MITYFDKKVIRENLSEIEQIEDYLNLLGQDLYDLLDEYRHYSKTD